MTAALRRCVLHQWYMFRAMLPCPHAPQLLLPLPLPLPLLLLLLLQLPAPELGRKATCSRS